MNTNEAIDIRVNQLAELGSEYWDNHFDNEHTELLKLLLGSKLINNDDDIEIALSNGDSLLDYNMYGKDFHLFLICKGKFKFEIQWIVEDYKTGELKPYTKKIENLKTIPSGLIELMEEVKKTGVGKIINVKSIKRL